MKKFIMPGISGTQNTPLLRQTKIDSFDSVQGGMLVQVEGVILNKMSIISFNHGAAEWLEPA